MIYRYKGYAYIFGKPISEKPIYLEVEANSLRQAKAKIEYRIKNWIALSKYARMEIDTNCIKQISEEERVYMGHRKIILGDF